MKTATKITETNLQHACDYLQKQFDARSWWPRAQPGLAKQEFKLMHNSPGALNVWCERWLDSSQLRKLERKIQKLT
jgi:hypothetical protein